MIWIIALAFLSVLIATSPVAAILSGTFTALFYTVYRTRQDAMVRLIVVFSLFVANHFIFQSLIGTLSKNGATTPELAVMRFITSDMTLLAMAFGSMLATLVFIVKAPRETWAPKTARKDSGPSDKPTEN